MEYGEYVPNQDLDRRDNKQGINILTRQSSTATTCDSKLQSADSIKAILNLKLTCSLASPHSHIKYQFRLGLIQCNISKSTRYGDRGYEGFTYKQFVNFEYSSHFMIRFATLKYPRAKQQ